MFDMSDPEFGDRPSKASQNRRKRKARRAGRPDEQKFMQWVKTVGESIGTMSMPKDIMIFPGCGCTGGNHRATRISTIAPWMHANCPKEAQATKVEQAGTPSADVIVECGGQNR